MNILILSVGTRNKIVEYFKKTLKKRGYKDSKVIACDMNELAPALYEADKHYLVPRIDDINYIDIILNICKKENIRGVLSLIDPELSLLAKNKNRFEELGVKIIGSSESCCELALNKMKMHDFLLSNNFKTARSYMDIDKFKNDLEADLINFPVFLKPFDGSASIMINKVDDLEELNLLMKKNKKLMIQEYLVGKELGVDVYIDLISKEVVSIFAKEKIVMRAGETDKACSIKDEGLFSLVEDFVRKAGFLGQIDIDVFDIGGEYYISEVNPRFGGGYPHAYECGIDHMDLIINNLEGKTNKKNIGKYDSGIYMMKYNEISVM